jgi:hypothetical protein
MVYIMKVDPIKKTNPKESVTEGGESQKEEKKRVEEILEVCPICFKDIMKADEHITLP